jgi:hypothetical protein
MDVIRCLERKTHSIGYIGERLERHAQPPGFCGLLVADVGPHVPLRVKELGTTVIGPLADEVPFIEQDEEATVAIQGLVAPAAALSGAKLPNEDGRQRALEVSRVHGCKDIGG